MDYVLAVQAPAYPLAGGRCATESAFAEHLRQLRLRIGPRFARLVLIAPSLTDDEYARLKPGLGELSEADDGVQFVPAYPTSVSRPGFWLHHLRPVWKRSRDAVRTASIVHSGMSTQLGHPLMAMVNLAGWLAKKPVVFMVDIDFRRHAERYRRLGSWSLKSYLVNRYLYDPLKWLQCWLAPRMFTLVCLKSASMVKDFGQGRPNVRNFYDTVHAEHHVLNADELAAKEAAARDASRPLVVGYFGRLAPNKGMDRAVEAVRLARARGADVRLRLIGAGDCLEALQHQVRDAGLGDAVSFEPPVAYGAPLFERLADVHLSVAAPLIEDTPRAAFDSMARGIPIVAFDITYFDDLARASGAVRVTPWPEAGGLAEAFVELAGDRAKLAGMTSAAVAFARDNTQDIWLKRRTQWLMELL
ncbi:MAG TPA: glycosyltransferase [Methylibium sp.]|uniref:glycosyltransferase n=1 Tax=Methylibium sp. TaxID=2067992 RepID=UPI002DB70B8D|nr:glycosyltransferase [Methylibium sp.]HEU4459283.1 glycosyltransferase [Methylibium sp.]